MVDVNLNMDWNYAYTLDLWPAVAALCLMLLLAAYSWLRRSVPGALPFMVACLFTSLRLFKESKTVMAYQVLCLAHAGYQGLADLHTNSQTTKEEVEASPTDS